MNLQDIFERVGRDVAILQRPRLRQSPAPAQLIASSPMAQESQFAFQDDSAGVELQHNRGWVNTAITRIGEAGASQPIHVARKLDAPMPVDRMRRQKAMLRGTPVPRWLKAHDAELDVLDSHALLDVLDDPNELMVRAVLLRVTLYQFLLTGKAYWWTLLAGDTYKIWPIPPHWVTPKHDDDKLFARWEIRPPGAVEPTVVESEELAYFYNPDPADPLKAISPLRTVGKAVLVDEAILDGQHRAMKNGIYPGSLITIGRLPGMDPSEPRPMLTRDQRETLIRSIKRMYAGVMRADEPLILDALVESIQPFTTSPREMDWMESAKSTKGRITQAYGVNPLIYGEIEGANRAQAFVARQLFAERVVNPILELFSQVMTAWVAPVFAAEGEKLVVWIEPSVADDDEMRLKELMLLDRAKAIGRREMRAVLGPRLGLPVDPEEDDTIVVQQAQIVQPLLLDASDIEEPEPPPEPALPPPDEDEEDPPDEDDSDDEAPQEEESAGAKRSAYRAQRIEYAKRTFLKQHDAAQAIIEMSARRFFAEQREDVRLKLRDAPPVAADLIFNPVEWDARLRSTMRRPLMVAMVRGAQTELVSTRSAGSHAKQVVDDPILMDIPPHILPFIEAELDAVFAQDYWSKINETTRAGIDKAIRSGVEDHLGPQEIATRILAELSPGNTRWRATTIARTETTSSLNAGHASVIEALGDSGDVTGKTWLSIPDERRRETHAALHDVTVPPDGDFDVGGFPAPYPGHHSLPASERLLCRCVVISEIPELASSNGRITKALLGA